MQVAAGAPQQQVHRRVRLHARTRCMLACLHHDIDSTDNGLGFTLNPNTVVPAAAPLFAAPSSSNVLATTCVGRIGAATVLTLFLHDSGAGQQTCCSIS